MLELIIADLVAEIRVLNNHLKRMEDLRLAAPEPAPAKRTRKKGDTEPVAAEPVAAEPVAAEPVAAEPVAAEPVTAEPVTAEPVASQSPLELHLAVKAAAMRLAAKTSKAFVMDLIKGKTGANTLAEIADDQLPAVLADLQQALEKA